MAVEQVRVINTGRDTVGEDTLSEIQRAIGVAGLEKVRTNRVFSLEGATAEGIQTLTEKLLSEPIDQESTLNEPIITDAPHVIHVAYQKGVMNPEVEYIMKGAADLGVPLEAADSGTEYAFYGVVTEDEVRTIARRLLVNEITQHIVTEKPETLKITGEVGPTKEVAIRAATAEGLLELSKDKLFLTLQEMQAVQNYFLELGRDPTDCELEIIAARWSEHCVHKTFKKEIIINGERKQPLLTRIREASEEHFGDTVVSAFKDNAGVYRLAEVDGEFIDFFHKVETHNGPSALDGSGGAATGVGGVVRDIIGAGLGAEVVATQDVFSFASPDLDPSLSPPGTQRPDHLLRKVVEGVQSYGNSFGAQTNNGSLHFHEDFRAKPSVFVGAQGIAPEKYSQKGEPQLNDLVVVIGGKTGRDGIHGATFSSAGMTERTSEVNSKAVQIGHPIEQQKFAQAIPELRNAGLIRAITDCGAAGLSSAVGEMGEDIGVTIDLSTVPLKYPGLAPWEIMISESQERMVLAVSPDNIELFHKICKKYNVESTVIGLFDGSKRMKAMYKDEVIADMDYDFLKHGLPMDAIEAVYEREVFPESELPRLENAEAWITTIKKVISHGNVCSKQPIVERYDHTVGATNALLPFSGVHLDGPNDASVITPILGNRVAVVSAHGMNPVMTRIDAYEGAVWSWTEAMANYVAAGGNPDNAHFLNNYVWPGVDVKSVGSLDRAVDGVVACIKKYKRPIISGKDSLGSRYTNKNLGIVIDIPPEVLISVSGGIEDVRNTVSADIKKPGSSLYIVGDMSPHMGGTTYYDVNGQVGNEIPKVDLDRAPDVFRKMHQAIQTGQVMACHDISEGGVIGMLTEMAIGGDCGVRLQLTDLPMDEENFLLNETAGCFIVEVDDDETAQKLFEGVTYQRLGTTTNEKEIVATSGDKELFTVSVDELKQEWQAPLRRLFP